jgi:hypothetical protein
MTMDPQTIEARPPRRRFFHLLAPYRIVACIEVAAGIIGLHVCLGQLVKNGFAQPAIINTAILVAFGLFFSLAIVAGVRLLRQDRTGYIFSIIVQSLQIPLLISDLLVYRITMLVRMVIFTRHITNSDINIFFGYDFNVLDIGFQLLFRNNTNEITLGINLIPILFIAVIYASWRKHGRRHAPQVPQKQVGSDPWSSNAPPTT